MPELKVDFKNLGPIRLMPLETSSLFLPFGRPLADYLRGAVASQNGARVLLRQGAMDFSPLIRWTESMAWTMRTTGFGELERGGIVESVPPAGPRDPAVADFLPVAPEGRHAQNSNPKILPAVAREGLPISKPRILSLPLRPRMTFGPPPASKTKPASVPAPAPVSTPVPGPKLVAQPVAAKPAAATVATPPKPGPVLAPKPVTPVKGGAPTPAQPKPVTVIPPKPSVAPMPAPGPRVAVPLPPAAAVTAPAAKIPDTPSAPPAAKPVAAAVSPVSPKTTAPAARAPEPSPAPALKVAAPQAPTQAKPGPVSAPPPAPPQARTPEAKDSPIAASSSNSPAATTVKVVASPIAPKPAIPPVSSGRAPAAPPVEAIPRVEAPKPAEPIVAPAVERHLTLGDDRPESLLERIPMPVKIGVAMLALMVIFYLVFGRSAKSSNDGAVVTVGEQGWSTEQVSDPVGSRHGRQLTIYRPSVGMTDYQLQFSAQIETKAAGWFFREMDTQNYYAMKIENLAPGKMAITHFAVIDGRESGYSQRPLGVDARPGALYRVILDVTGPRFTTYVGGEPVDFWTDNRLKAGAVGFMSERDERGASSAVRFTFPRGQK